MTQTWHRASFTTQGGSLPAVTTMQLAPRMGTDSEIGCGTMGPGNEGLMARVSDLGSVQQLAEFKIDGERQRQMERDRRTETGDVAAEGVFFCDSVPLECDLGGYSYSRSRASGRGVRVPGAWAVLVGSHTLEAPGSWTLARATIGGTRCLAGRRTHLRALGSRTEFLWFNWHFGLPRYQKL